MIDVKEVKYDLEMFFEGQEDIIYNNLENHLQLHYDTKEAEAIFNVIKNENHIEVGLEDMTTFRQELRNKLED